MRFELTISGLCVIAMKSKDKTKDPRPKNPERVDIIVPEVHHPKHKCCLVWDPFDVVTKIKPNLIVTNVGKTLGSFDLDRSLELQFLTAANPGFDVSWGPPKEAPKVDSDEEQWLNWVPPMEALGFPAVRVPLLGTRATGERARISLPFGKIIADELVKTQDDKPLVWKFPDNSKRVLANKVRYVVDDDDVRGYTFLDTAGKPFIGLEVEGPHTVKMCISNDMEMLPEDYTLGIDKLDHLSHVNVLVPEARRPRIFTAPETTAAQRTGNRICTQVVNVWDGKTT